MHLQLTLQYYKALGKVTERRNSWKLRAATAHSWTWWTSSTVSQHSYLNRRLLTNPWPCVKKQQRITVHSRNCSTSNNRTAERQKVRMAERNLQWPRPSPYQPPRVAARVVWEWDNPTWLHSDFFFSQYNNGVNISVVYYLLLYTI